MKKLTYRLDEQLDQELAAFAESRGLSKAEVVRRAIDREIARVEHPAGAQARLNERGGVDSTDAQSLTSDN